MIELMTRTSNQSFDGTRALPPNEKRWQSVQTRDRGADGAFVYAVRSTGIYCRPSCASRKPRREQVEFFSLPAAAEQRGFRACLRCRPRLARLRDPRTAAVAKVCREIEAQIDADGNFSAAVCGCAADAPVEVQIAKRR
jgi:methylphosphotriester-DNA--protein-cysteine methyltransferase